MRKAIVSNILYSAIEKIFLLGSQFAASILLIRLLPRQDYGVIGVVAGYFVFISIINISLEAIILRDHEKYDYRIEKYIYNFFLFNILKSLLFVIIAIVLAFFLENRFSNSSFLYSVFSITAITIADSLVAPLMIYQSSKYNQRFVAMILTCRYLLNIFVLLGLFYFPTLKYIFIKDLIISFVYIITWFHMSKNVFDVKRIRFFEDFDLEFIKTSLLGYSIWTHFVNVAINLVYRSDTFFLSLFVGLKTVGNYNIALNSANVANIFPMILGYQNSIAISRAKSDKLASQISNTFIRISAYLGLLTFIVFSFGGDYYLYLITGESENKEIYSYMIYIVISLILAKTFVNPLNSFINIKGSVKSLFLHVLMPLIVFTCFVYLIAAQKFGANGIAIANICVAIVWVFLLLREIKTYDYDFSTILNIRDDFMFLKTSLSIVMKKFKKEDKNEKSN